MQNIETVADIVKEKRDRADEVEKGGNTFAYDLAKMLREEANRIEAAYKREVESYKRLLMTSQCALEDEIVKNQNLKRELDSRAIIAGASMADALAAENAKYSFFSPQPKPREIVL